MKGKTVRRWMCVGLVAALTGCAGARSGKVTYRDPNMDFSLAQNVAVMPFINLTTTNAAGERVRDVLMTMLQATGALYVLPPGEVARGIARTSISNPAAPTKDEVVAFGKATGADMVVTGTLLEYGEIRSGSASANVVSLSLRMMEAQTGKMIWSASSTEGGITAKDRLLGGGGQPMDSVTEKAISDLLDKLFEK